MVYEIQGSINKFIVHVGISGISIFHLLYLSILSINHFFENNYLKQSQNLNNQFINQQKEYFNEY